ncbi:catalase family protein [Pseudoduganella namucuonensis]|uniref:Catalase n=1 Tax=Pseudoduganella namucuonensis TaxID=1035707 RepID=A0A1I7LNH4_9BURK|nr:catalase family protein [Pseudoduganella namucuonensis]SFV11185.1 hypothetical protein SAMN05216552_103353 [Pseudoduganella namucuonensis]
MNPIQAVPYCAAYEFAEDDEAETAAGLRDTMLGISRKTWEHSGHGLRSVHAKSHGLLVAELTVRDGLPECYAQGLFARPGGYPAVLRISTTPGDLLDDKVSTPRGLGLKIVGVPGARVEGGEGDATQDFVLVNGPAFLVPKAKAFLSNLKPLAATTDKVPNLKRAFSALLRGTEQAIEAAGGESARIKALGGHPETHPLGETYFSQAPILYGRYMAKVSLAPVSPGLVALAGAHVDLAHKPDGLREAVVAHFAREGGEWELRVQLCTNIEEMPIEDASAEWRQDLSPYVAVARLRAGPQRGWSEELARLVDDGMRFNPWHALAAHRPLGSIMRVRKSVYAASARLRAERNGVELVEPRDIADVRAAAGVAGA